MMDSTAEKTNGHHKPIPSIYVWISDDKADDDEDILDSILRFRRREPSEPRYEPKTLHRWQNAASESDLSHLEEQIREDLHLYGSDDDDEPEPEIDDDDIPTWTEDFKTFTAKPLPFTGTSGPTVTSTDPVTLFLKVWDSNIMSLIAEETNRYARQVAELQNNEEDIPETYIEVEWKDTTFEELYVMFALLIFSTVDSPEKSFFGEITIPVFSEIMDLERFKVLYQCLHFVDNTKLPETNKMLEKLKPIIHHCNKKFTELYKPGQALDIDVSMLLSKEGTTARRLLEAYYFDIRTYELSDVSTGYFLKFLLYPGIDQYPGTEEEKTYREIEQGVLELVNEYSNKGHIIVTDKYFSSVHLARTLKSKGFDFVGEVKRTRRDLPVVIRNLADDDDNPELFRLNRKRVKILSRHCGDLSVLAWSKMKLITLSTYHTADIKPSTRKAIRPIVSADYLKMKEAIYERDADLFESKLIQHPSERWYIKVFKRLLIHSLRNIYVIYKCNMKENYIKEAKFRFLLANQLLDLFGVREDVERARAMRRAGLCEDSDDEYMSESEDTDEEQNPSSVDST